MMWIYSTLVPVLFGTVVNSLPHWLPKIVAFLYAEAAFMAIVAVQIDDFRSALTRSQIDIRDDDDKVISWPLGLCYWL
jgi:hypothetical protein